MKQVLQFRRSGATRVVDVPAPQVQRGGLLVHNRCSLISPGTERMLVEAGGANLLNTARQRPDLVRQVIDTVKSVSGVNFRVNEAPRRAGDPASITATGEKVRRVLGWTPAHDDLREMVGSALEWERYLMTRNR